MIKETIERVKAETPTYFKKLIKIGLVLSAVGGAIMAIPETFPTVVMPPSIFTLGSYMLVAGFIIAAVSKATKVD